MKTNIGTPDRALRAGVGVGLLLLTAGGVIGPWGYIGVVPLSTGLFGFCPAYSLFSFSSCPLDAR